MANSRCIWDSFRKNSTFSRNERADHRLQKVAKFLRNLQLLTFYNWYETYCFILLYILILKILFFLLNILKQLTFCIFWPMRWFFQGSIMLHEIARLHIFAEVTGAIEKSWLQWSRAFLRNYDLAKRLVWRTQQPAKNSHRDRDQSNRKCITNKETLYRKCILRITLS